MQQILSLCTTLIMGNVVTAAHVGCIVIPAVFSGWVVREANIHIAKDSDQKEVGTFISLFLGII